MRNRSDDEAEDRRPSRYRLEGEQDENDAPEEPVRKQRRPRKKDPRAAVERMAERLSSDTGRCPTAATYQHLVCGSYTEVSDFDFKRAADPFEFVPGTYCASCGNSAGLGAFEWTGHPGQTLREWRAAMRRKAPASLVLFRWVFGPLFLVLVGGGLGLLFSKDPWGGLTGAILGLVLAPMFVLAPLSWVIWGDYYRTVRQSAAR